MKEITETCSLALLCQSSKLLETNNLKKCSYPFDWIFSTFEMIIDCIEDDFNKFLDKSNNLGLSKMAYNFLGGVIKNASSLSAFFNPTINSKGLKCTSALFIPVQALQHSSTLWPACGTLALQHPASSIMSTPGSLTTPLR